jgi:hypothetical protein
MPPVGKAAITARKKVLTMSACRCADALMF